MAKTKTKTNAKTNVNAKAPAASDGPWRKGRPSFKAFYPEIIFLTIVTVAFIALAARLSCSELKPKSEKAEPTPVSSATFFLTPQAFAQDASLDATSSTEETSASQAADANVIAPGNDLGPFEATAPEAETEAVESTPNETEAKAAKSGASAKILAIWIVCLAIPALLWIWRVWKWICAVYGVKFEIRCDDDNPKATTILVTRGIFNKKTDSMHIAQVKDIQSSQTFFQKYFQGGVGTISLFTQDLTDGILKMENMEDPSRVFNALDELRRRYWALGGFGGRMEGVVPDNVEGVSDAM